MRYVYLVLITLIATITPAFADTHCFCKLGPVDSPIHDFGQVAGWTTKYGHDKACKDACNIHTDEFMRNAGNRAAACARMNGAPVVNYYAIGTGAYTAGGTYNCPQTGPTPTPGIVTFPGGSQSHQLIIDGTQYNWYQVPPTVTVSHTKQFITFEFYDGLTFHVQQWTYYARLYRNNSIVEELRGITHGGGNVYVRFTEQPNSFVRGQTWKIVTHYGGPGYTDLSTSFFVNP
jgi:hypothetical protein